jgi:branched-subunit amino acid aminotransferase/4-amino-4-deoxychorismate lyase
MMELDGQPATAEQVAALALRNYGHFTSMRIENGAVRGLGMHLERLDQDCRAIHGVGLDPDRVRRYVRQAIADIDQPVVVRVTIYDPGLDLGHPGGTAEPHVLVSGRQAAAQTLPPIKLQSVSYQRDLPAVKHVGLFGPVYHRRSAQLDGYDDVLFVDTAKQISEGATWNICFYDGERIIWPDAECLPGVTMRLLQADARAVAWTSASVALHQLADMRAAFITNAAIGVRPVESIDLIRYEPVPELVQTLQDEYAAITAEPL